MKCPDKGEFAGGVFVNLQKAFDTVDLKILDHWNLTIVTFEDAVTIGLYQIYQRESNFSPLATLILTLDKLCPSGFSVVSSVILDLYQWSSFW